MLDNIDIISDGTTDIFQNTMMGIWKFMWDTRNVFAKIRENQREDDKYFVEVAGKEYQILYASVTYFHLRDGSQVSVTIPAQNDEATWAAVEAAL